VTNNRVPKSRKQKNTGTKFPDWAPPQIVDAIAFMQADDSRHEQFSGYQDNLGRMIEMWTRLSTRPEMKPVWEWYFASDLSKIFGFHDHRSLFYCASVIDEVFPVAPKLSSQAYKVEMNEIAALANKLADKMRKFDFPTENTFALHNIVSPLYLDDADDATNEDRLSSWMDATRHFDRWIPSMPDLLNRIEAFAIREGHEQWSRLPMSRKVNGPSAYRSFFIRTVAYHFDRSPARIAIFCSVALDDPDITADMVRKLIKEQKGASE
jgi:hypothetical protein